MGARKDKLRGHGVRIEGPVVEQLQGAFAENGWRRRASDRRADYFRASAWSRRVTSTPRWCEAPRGRQHRDVYDVLLALASFRGTPFTHQPLLRAR